MSVSKYKARGVTYWRVDFRVSLPDGSRKRVQRGRIPTKELAQAIESKVRTAVFEGKYFRKFGESDVKTVADAWKVYKVRAERDNRSWDTDRGRANHLVEHLGSTVVENLSEHNIDEYRNKRLTETTVRGAPPSPATLDREVELLKRMLNYAVRSRMIRSNPVAHVRLLREPNTRDMVLSQEDFERLLDAADAAIRPILVMAYETGMRKDEILSLRWDHVEIQWVDKEPVSGVIRLRPQDTKEQKARMVFLTDRILAEFKDLAVSISGYVWVNPATNTRWMDIRKAWKRALKGAGLTGVRFHDLRRSFVSNARRRGIPESVVMAMSGHRTRAVFDRYNIVDDRDRQEAVEKLQLGRAAELAKG